MADCERFTFTLRIDGGDARQFASRHSEYSLAIMEAWGALDMPYPCSVEIWVPDLVEAGYGPYFYRIDDFVDCRGNTYVCPSIMTDISSALAHRALIAQPPGAQ